jgi:hypothetical protein
VRATYNYSKGSHDDKLSEDNSKTDLHDLEKALGVNRPEKIELISESNVSNVEDISERRSPTIKEFSPSLKVLDDSSRAVEKSDERVSTLTEIDSHSAVIDGTGDTLEDITSDLDNSEVDTDYDPFTKAVPSLDIVFISIDYYEEWSQYYEIYVNTRNIYVLVDSNLSHLKSKSHATRLLKDSGYLMVDYNVWKDISNKYNASLIPIITKLNPIDKGYFIDMNRVVFDQSKSAEAPIYGLLPNRQLFFAELLYAMAQGSGDLLMYSHSTYSSVNVDLQYSNSLSSKDRRSINIIVRNGSKEDSVKVEKLQFVYDNVLTDAKYYIKDNQSMFTKSLYSNLFKTMYNLDSYENSVETVQSTETVRRGVVTRDKMEGAGFAEGFKIEVVINGGVAIDIRDKSLIDMTLIWLHLDYLKEHFTRSEIDTIASYFGTTLYNNVLNQMLLKQGVTIRNVTLKFSVTRISESNNHIKLHNHFKDHVHRGWIVPISPIQFDYYLNGHKTLDAWKYYSILSAMANPDINNIFREVLPSIDIQSKRNFRLYMKNSSMLDSKFYVSDVSLPFKIYSHFKLNVESFILEMMMRTFTRDRMPDYLPLISRGNWVGTDSKSLEVGIPSLNPIYVKFMSPTDKSMFNFVEMLTLRSADNAPEHYMRRQSRLVNHMPELIRSFVPRISTNNYDEI